MTRYLTTEDLFDIAVELGSDVEVRDLGLLDGAAHRPAATVFGDDTYPDIHLKAAVLLESIVRGQPLTDGNERLSWASTVVFLALNGIVVTAPHDDAYDLVIAVAQGLRSPEDVAALLRDWC
ncbi:type II toxin-antitoxin system death-on-curing family toxin [Luteipulveratus mongoliensis]|uniref:Fido domain-containing protein n=1 Tax=Luteipulveratus mongoliensis TaxID=571913 RepID=A0A0K1JND9_9MICO|nr:Fic family protein [Luteipulveratus mongoliensis]AKU18110.1 hypothetical protein VV02_23335 [Luteipulveratus mongoliensis]